MPTDGRTTTLGSLTERLKLSTRALLDRYRRGRATALDIILAREIPDLRRWARGRLPRWARSFIDTGDLVQDAVARTMPQLARFEPQHKKALQAYLRNAVRNAITDELRRVGRNPQEQFDETFAGDTVAATGPSPLEWLLRSEEDAQFASALAQLSGQDRAAIVARLRMGYSYEQVALVLGKRSPDAARMAVTRAIERLMRQLVQDSASSRG